MSNTLSQTKRDTAVSKNSGWQLCGDGPEAYEKYIVPAFSGAWARDLVNRANLQNGDSVLDVGCGTGIVSRYAAEALGESGGVTGLDISETVLKKAREICPPGVSPIDWKKGDVTALPFADNTFDVVLCQQGLQYFPDKLRALNEVSRVLTGNGRIVFSVWRPMAYFPFYLALHSTLGEFVGEKAASMLADAFSFGEPTRIRTLFKKAEFKNIKICLEIKQMRYDPLDEFLAGGFVASPFVNDILSLEESKRDDMFQTVKNSIRNYVDDSGLAAPMECNVISAIK